MNVNWSLVFTGGAFAFTLITAICSTVYFVVSLIIKPLKEDLDEVKDIMKNVKTDVDLERLIQLSIAKHKEECLR